MASSPHHKRRALISVYDKTGIIDLARALIAFDIEIIATSGTAQMLKKADIDALTIEDITQFPEMMDGRVKTLHPKIHAGILARRDIKSHQEQMAVHHIEAIDFLIVNFYPFAETLARNASREDIIENIDIGAPSMVRGAAKNHQFVTVILERTDYDSLAQELKTHNGQTSLAFRELCARKAFKATSAYDKMISDWFHHDDEGDNPKASNDKAQVAQMVLKGQDEKPLRYGENPHQKARLFLFADQSQNRGIAQAEQIQGKPLSYNNYADGDCAWALVNEFDEPCAAIIKHANPCGVAIHRDITQAYSHAFKADKTSAFGGIVALNKPLTAKLAQKITEIFTECVIAPSIDKKDEDAVKQIFSRKKNLRLLLAPKPKYGADHIQVISGGFLAQQPDKAKLDIRQIQNIGGRAPSAQEEKDMLFAWIICKYVKSNAIILAQNGSSCGIGAGQMSRIDSAKIAISKKPDWVKDAVCASDAFFPFADGVAILAKAGISAFIQPGGSMRDKEVEAYAKKHNLVMWLTHMRHFRH